MRPLLVAALFATLLAGGARAVQPDEILPDPALEARARAISAGLRCLVCQNQSIDDSDASLAKDLRLVVRERLTAGDGDAAVRDFVVRRYGEFVLLNPVVAPHTLLLWGTPLVVLGAGALGLWLASRRRRVPPPAGLSPAESEALNRLLGREPG